MQNVDFTFVSQEVLVDTATYTAKATALTRRRWAQLCSITDLVAVLALKSNVPTTHGGATPEAPLSSSPPPTSAHRISPYQTTMVVGATLLALTLTSPCPCFLKLQSIVPESSPSLTAGMPFSPPPFLFNNIIPVKHTTFYAWGTSYQWFDRFDINTPRREYTSIIYICFLWFD